MIQESPEYRVIMAERAATIQHQDHAHEPDGEDMAAMVAAEFDASPVDDDDDLPF
jgi:hypothetical protein